MGKMRRHINTGGYQRSIYIWTSIFFIISQILFSAAILVKTYQQEVQANYEMNEQIFRQVAYNVEQSDSVIRVLTYVLYENLDSSGKPDGAIIINVDFDMFVDEIRQLITFSEEEKSGVFIFSQENEILNREEGNENPEVEALQPYRTAGAEGQGQRCGGDRG